MLDKDTMTIRGYKGLFSDLYLFLTKYGDILDDDASWGNLVKEADALGQKYGSDFACEFIIAVVNEIERSNRRRKNIKKKLDELI